MLGAAGVPLAFSFSRLSSGAGVTSSMPMEKPWFPMKRELSFATRFMHCADAWGKHGASRISEAPSKGRMGKNSQTFGLKSAAIVWNSPALLPLPRVDLPSLPQISSLRRSRRRGSGQARQHQEPGTSQKETPAFDE